MSSILVVKMQDFVQLAVVFFTVALTSASLSRYYSKEVGKRAIANVTEHALFQQNVQGNALQFHCMFQCERDSACRAVNVGKNNMCELIFSPSYYVADEASFNLIIGDYGCPGGFDNIFQMGTTSTSKRFIPSCYKVEKGLRTWEQAKAFCDMIGGHLLTIETPEEQNHVVSNLDLSVGVWTSGYDQDLDGNWKWTSPAADMVYTNWADGEPGNMKFVDEGCFILWQVRGYQWADVPCQNKYATICEKTVTFCK